MKKRILSLVLAVVMCFSVVSVFAANDEAELMGEIGDLVNNYRDRIWTWQGNQFDAMTDEQTEAIDNAWTSYEAKKDDVKAIAVELAEELATDKALSNETMKDLYKWKLMRDIMEGRIEVISEDAAYLDWLARFTAFEEANDEAVSPSYPTAALGNLGGYSADLTEFYGELAVLVNGGLVLEGADAAKAELYVEALNAEKIGEAYPDGFAEELKLDVVELASEGMFNVFDLGMQVATNQINEENTTGLFDMIPDRDMKAAFLILGEDFVKYLLDLIPVMKDNLLHMPKDELVTAVAKANGTGIMSDDNNVTVTAMYDAMLAVAEHIAAQDFSAEAVSKVDEEYGLVVAEKLPSFVEKLEKAMNTIDANHGIELIHFNTYMGRELLRYENGEEWTKLSGAEIDGDTVTELTLGYAHDRYPVIGKLNELSLSLAQFDANYDADGIKVHSGDDESPIGMLYFEVAEDANGTATVEVYRGYTDGGSDEDVYRYVTSFTVKATSDVVPPVVEDPYVTLEDVLDTTVDGTVTIKGETNLDYVTVSILKTDENGELNTIYAVVYSKAEFEAGITLNAPDNAQVGEVYTVVVGTEKASASDEFAIEGAAEEYEVVLEDVANTTVDGTITVKGTTTNLDYVTVAIVKTVEGEAKTIYAVVYTKAEFEAGITLNAPDNAQVGEVYTVVVGTEKASDSDEFEIVSDEEPIVYEITLEDIADFKLSDNENAEIVVKGTTNLDYVIVTVTLGSENVYAVTHTKAEYEAGIAIRIDNAAAGNVYTVAVGQTGTEAEDTFTILAEEPVAPSGKLAVAGSTTRKASVNGTVTITTTPQSIQPEGATVEVVWTTEDGGIIEVTSVAGDYNNIATITKLQKGTEKVTATLYVNGVAVDSKVITITNKSSSTGGGRVYTNITVKVDETKDVVKVPAGAVEVEFNGTGEGEVEVSIVDGVVVVTGVKVGEVKGTVDVKNANGKVVLTGDYKFTVTEKDVVVVPEHKCEWPDIAATATKDAHWAHETIDIMTINGYIKGYEDGTFKPDQNITRAEFSAIVYRILGLEEAEDGVLYDDTVGHWAEDIIATMSLPEGYGMLRGYGDGNFGPNDNITREQAVAIIARAKSAVWVEAEEGAKDVFTDAEDISWWFDGEMDAAVANGLITGYEDGSYKPLNFTTRAEACVLLARAWPEVLE